MENQPTTPSPLLAQATPTRKHAKRNKILKITGISLFGLCLIGSGFGTGYLVGTKHASANSSNNVDNVSSVTPPKTAKKKAKNGKNRVTGVVTSVTATSITVAGGGKTRIVALSSTTTYAKNTKPVVNDTIVAVGATTNGVFTATQITVEP